ncbi:hypothetical protein V9K67_10360 [Paraflavisolibacter sp. H34]|uniref:hypothetical protein n=1 Tax=Huijunlia imazamoxiresistens TaxID=3127457 RepID=UPI003016CB03
MHPANEKRKFFESKLRLKVWFDREVEKKLLAENKKPLIFAPPITENDGPGALKKGKRSLKDWKATASFS